MENVLVKYYKTKMNPEKKTQLMPKQEKNILGDTNFLLGIRKSDGERVWLEDFEWNCDWYWGGGYVEVYNKRHTDVSEHTHFDILFLKKDIFDGFKNYFSKTTLTDDEIWRLLDLLKQFYALRNCAEVFQYGGHLISKGRTKKELDKNMANKINAHIKNVIIPLTRDLLRKRQ